MNKYKLFLIILFLTFILDSIGGTKEMISIKRLGNEKSGVVKKGNFQEEINDPGPIVLGSKNGAPSVYYYSTKTNTKEGSVSQNIIKIGHEEDNGIIRMAKDILDPFPISFSGSANTKEEENHLDNIVNDKIVTADIDMDGNEEMIIPRNLGDIAVYSRSKLLFNFTPPNFKNRSFIYDIVNTQKVSLKDRDIVFYIIRRKVNGEISDINKEDASYNSNNPTDLIIMFDKNGIKSVSLNSINVKISRVLGITAINKQGSNENEIDNLVICFEEKGSKEIFISNLKIDGTMIGTPQKITLGKQNFSEFHFEFIPQSNKTIIFNNHDLFFINQDKKENWIQKVDLEKTIGDEDVRFIGTIRNVMPIALVQNKNNIYALNEEGSFLKLEDGRDISYTNQIPFLTIRPDSPLHEVISVKLIGQDKDRVLVVQSLKPQDKSLSDEEVTSAGEKFISDKERSFWKEMYKLNFDDYVSNKVKSQSKEKGIDNKISSLEEVKKYLPDLYLSLEKEAKEKYILSEKTILLAPFEKYRDIESSVYKNKEEYIAWLQSNFIRGEILFTISDFKGTESYKGKIEDYFQPNLETNMAKDLITYTENSQGKFIVMTLKKKTLIEENEQSYYLIIL